MSHQARTESPSPGVLPAQSQAAPEGQCAGTSPAQEPVFMMTLLLAGAGAGTLWGTPETTPAPEVAPAGKATAPD